MTKLIVVGTYERLLYGLHFSTSFHEQFIYPAHISSITCLSISGNLLATGSTDEHVKLYDLRQQKEVGSLLNHSGTISALSFVKNQHLVTASEDGTIGIFRVHDWENLFTLQGHTKGISAMKVHPSGKLLISCGKDKTCRLWDLMRGQQEQQFKIHGIVHKIGWSNSGSHYFLCYDSRIQCIEIATDARYLIECKSRINSCSFAQMGNELVIIYGGEDKIIRIVNAKCEPLKEWSSGHELRIKDLAVSDNLLVTCSSDGCIKVWNLSTQELEGEYNTKCRVTCIDIAEAPKVRQKVVTEKEEFPESDYDDVPKQSAQKISVSYDSKGNIKAQTDKSTIKMKPQKNKIFKKKHKGKKNSKNE